jgi:hypothetical protein
MRVLTTDVFAGAWLMSRGARLVDLLVDRTGSRDTGTFVLEGPTALGDLEVYSRGEAVANVKAVRDGVTTLRTRLARALRHAA